MTEEQKKELFKPFALEFVNLLRKYNIQLQFASRYDEFTLYNKDGKKVATLCIYDIYDIWEEETGQDVYEVVGD